MAGIKLTIYSPVVNIFTSSFTIRKRRIFLQGILRCFVRFSQQTAIIYLNSIKLFVFVMEEFFCDAGIQFLRII